MRIPELQDLFAYNRWANARVFDAAARLTDEQAARDLGSSFPSVVATLAHIVGAERIWLQRWQGTSPTGASADWPEPATVPVLRELWQQVEAGQAAYIASLDAADLDRVITYRNTRGEPFEAPLAALLRHVVNHSTYHRGQVTTMLRQLGHAPPATDLVLYHRTAGD